MYYVDYLCNYAIKMLFLNHNVPSRGDRQEFSDLNKLAKRFLRGGKDAVGKNSKVVLSEAYVKEVVEELRNGEEKECPICLEACEDAVLTPCAHRLCRECLLASWRSATGGPCPVCRYSSVSTFCCSLKLYVKSILLMMNLLQEPRQEAGPSNCSYW